MADFDWSRATEPEEEAFDWNKSAEPAPATPKPPAPTEQRSSGSRAADALLDVQGAALLGPLGLLAVPELIKKHTGANVSNPLSETAADAATSAKQVNPFWDEMAGAAKVATDDGYAKSRDAERSSAKAAAERSPVAYYGTQVAGALAAPGPKPGLANALKYGAGAGLVYGAGASEADLTKGNVGRFAADTAFGGLAGGAMAGGGYLAAKGASKAYRGSKLEEMIKDFAEERAVKALGRDVKGVLHQGKQNELGRDLLDSGVVTFGSSKGTQADRLGALEKSRGAALEKIVSDIDAAALPSTPRDPAVDRVNVYDLAKELESKLVGPKRGTPAEAPTASFLQGEIDKIRQSANSGRGFLSISEAEKTLKRPYQARAKWDRTQGTNPEALKDLSSVIRGRIEDTAEGIAKQRRPDLAGKFADAKRSFGLAAEGADIVEKQMGRDLQNRFLSPSDYGFGAVSGVAGSASRGQGAGAAQGLIGAALHKVFRDRGSSMAAATADKLGREWLVGLPELVAAKPQYFGRYSPLLAKELETAGANGLRALYASIFGEDKKFAEEQAALIGGGQ